MIKLDNVTKRFDDFIALDNIELEIEKGMAYGLLGSNGAGKSTILRLVSGIYRADCGEVRVDGYNVYNNPKVKEKIIFINDETVQWTNYTLNEMKEYHKTFYKSFSEEKFNELWNVLKLPTDKRLATFSKGMKRQSVMICAIACQPDFLLIDEAFDGLDPTMRIIVKKMLVDAMLDNNMTAVISSHNLREIDEFCDKAGLLHKGKIVFNRDLDSVKGNVHKIQTAFKQPLAREAFQDIDILHYEVSGSLIYIIAKGNGEEIAGKIKRFDPMILDMIPLSLEEVFIYEMEVLGYEYKSGIDFGA